MFVYALLLAHYHLRRICWTELDDDDDDADDDDKKSNDEPSELEHTHKKLPSQGHYQSFAADNFLPLNFFSVIYSLS